MSADAQEPWLSARTRAARARVAWILLVLCHGVLAAAGPAPQKYAGDAACLSCHKEQVDSYGQTAHHLTSQLANRTSISGSFAAGSNVLMIADPAHATDDPGLYFKMEARPDGFYQTAVAGWPGHLQSRSERMDLVIGSGVRGKSYLYWRGQQLFELPVSYWTDGSRWINSPGYKNGTMNFARAVTPRCLECHTTFAEALSPDPAGNRYARESLIVGMSCERCHGPGAEHIALHKLPNTTMNRKGAETILNPARFSRDRQVDVCALCHNGIRTEELAPAFSFVPGKPLDDFLRPTAAEAASHPDVHGNQVALLKNSRCYQSSPTMTCSTCHEVHKPEQTAAAYSSRCLSCHQVESCGMARTMGPKIADNCIDCHMPVEPTQAIVSVTAGEEIRPKMRNHWIRVYTAKQGN